MEIQTPSEKSFEDTLNVTRATRIELGFSPRDEWRTAPAVFDEHSLKIQGHPVMEDWEDSYMAELAAIAASNGGVVLEVGYGMGISARKIQNYEIKKHFIIEANHDVYQKLLTFETTSKRHVVPLFGFWEEVTPSIPSGTVSGILFDTYPLCEEEIHQNHFPFFKEAFRLLAPGGTLTYYSDEVADFSPKHRSLLEKAGFKNIQKKICMLETPEGCDYWKSTMMIAPIVRK